jgi:hypothetical protein
VDRNLFNVISRELRRAPSRREVLIALFGVGIGVEALRIPNDAAAKKHRQSSHGKSHKHKKSAKLVPETPNQFGCLGVGQLCGGDSSVCCSGVCEGDEPKKGKRDTRSCAAHGTGTCDQAAVGACDAPEVNEQLTCNGNPNCVCFLTTAGSNFCVDASVSNSTDFCSNCHTDADCETQGFPRGSACLPFSSGRCTTGCTTRMFCGAPCAAPAA